jgi:hypothetical protein
MMAQTIGESKAKVNGTWVQANKPARDSSFTALPFWFLARRRAIFFHWNFHHHCNTEPALSGFSETSSGPAGSPCRNNSIRALRP